MREAGGVWEGGGRGGVEDARALGLLQRMLAEGTTNYRPVNVHCIHGEKKESGSEGEGEHALLVAS